MTETALAAREEQDIAAFPLADTMPLYQILARAARRWHCLSITQTRAALTSHRPDYWREKAAKSRELAWSNLKEAREAKAIATRS